MTQNENILDRLRKQDGGMTVPPGYFEDFAARMAEALPGQPWEQTAEAPSEAPRPTVWHRIRPYVYMAAMFAGVWLMMNIFNRIMPVSPDLSVDNNPVLTAAVENDSFMNDYFIDDLDQGDLYDEMYDSGARARDIVLDTADESQPASTSL